MGGSGGMGGMMGMMGVPMSSMSTSNVDLPFLKNKLIQELTGYNITDDKDMIISIIRSSDYIKELRRSLHQPTFFQEGIQDFIDGIQDKILKFPEKWKTEFTQTENTATLNELFHDMLKKYKDSVEEGGDMNTTDLYSLYQISNNAQNCGSSSPPPPKSSDKPKGPSMLSKLKNAASAATTRKNKPGDPAGTPGATPGAKGATPDGTQKKGMLASAKEKYNNLTRKLTPQEQEEAATKKAQAAEEKQKKKEDDAAAKKLKQEADAVAKKQKQDADAVAKKQKQDADAVAKAELAEKVRTGHASRLEKIEHEKNKLVTAVKTSASNAATAVKTSASNAATAVKTSASNAAKAVGDKVSAVGSAVGAKVDAGKAAVKTSASNVAKAVGAKVDAGKAAIGAKVDAGKAAIGDAAFAGKQVFKSGIYQARAIGTAVGAKARKATTTVKNKATALKTSAYDAYASGADKVVRGIANIQANQALRKYGGKQIGGGSGASQHRTRYISDIKHNRRRLYDREREIIQSIRNFENNNNRKESRHHKTRKLRNILMR